MNTRLGSADVYITWALICAKEILWCLTSFGISSWTIDKLRGARNVWMCWMKFIEVWRSVLKEEISNGSFNWMEYHWFSWLTFTTRSDEIEELKITIDEGLSFFSLWNIGRLKRKNDKNNVQNNRKMSLYYEGCYSDDVFFFSFEKHLKFNKEDSR